MTGTSPNQQHVGPPMPEMRDATLTVDDVWELVADLLAHARVTGMLCKVGAHRHTPPNNIPLEAAVEQLFARTVTAIQIRYQFRGSDWTDTLLHSAMGIRLVRCQHVSENTSVPPGST